jgi:transposase-like protein
MDNTNAGEAPAWAAPFLDALRSGKTVRAACREAGVTASTPYDRRRKNDAFRAEWDAIQPVDGRRQKKSGPRPPRDAARIERFLEELAITSNVAAAAEVADLPTGKVYALRRDNPDFARRWFAALAEGYDNLEMELLAHLRSGESGAPDAKRKFDVATALRCLTAHRESVAREKGRRTLADEVATIAAINAKIDELRTRAKEGEKAIRQARNAAAKRTGDDAQS